MLVLREKYGENNIWLHGTKVVEGLVDGERWILDMGIEMGAILTWWA